MTQQELDRPADAPQDAILTAETSVEEATGLRGPVNWRQVGLIAVGALAAILLIFQIMGGGAGTDVVPGTPVVQSQTQ